MVYIQGLGSDRFPLTGRQPGWDRHSYGYHGDDGHAFHAQGLGHGFGPPFGLGDTVGCGLDYCSGHIFFTLNGLLIGSPFRVEYNKELYPIIGLDAPWMIDCNFGARPFAFDLVRLESSTSHWGELQTLSFSQVRGLQPRTLPQVYRHYGRHRQPRRHASDSDFESESDLGSDLDFLPPTVHVPNDGPGADQELHALLQRLADTEAGLQILLELANEEMAEEEIDHDNNHDADLADPQPHEDSGENHDDGAADDESDGDTTDS